MLRSPFAHGTIAQLDTASAKAAPGVLAVYTGADLLAAGVRDLPGCDLPPSSLTPAQKAIQQPPLARDRVRYVGEPIVGIIAESMTAAKDASELIELDIEDLDPVVGIREALTDGAPQLHDRIPGNHFGTLEYGDRDATDAMFAAAAQTAEVEIVNNRLAPTAMEPRGCVAHPDPDTGRMTVYQGCQGVHVMRDRIRACLDLDDLRVVSPDVGGAFGLKFFLQCESVVAIHAAQELGRPVKWIGERAESFLSDLHGRDHITHGRIAMDEDGRFQALRITIDGNIGAYCSQAGAIIPWFGACMSSGVYDIPTGYVDVNMAFTNTVPTDAYRGAGRPEAAYLIERLVDEAARVTGLSRDEIRRRNFVKPEQFPYQTFTGRAYDSGEYPRLMEAALERADWGGFRAASRGECRARQAARDRPRLLRGDLLGSRRRADAHQVRERWTSDGADGHTVVRPRSRDELRPDDRRRARRGSRPDRHRAGRYRQGTDR